MLKILKDEKFSVLFTVSMVALALVAICVDLAAPNDKYWFQRSGALIALAGVELQYARLISTWQKAWQREMAIEPVESRLASGKGVSMLAMAKESVQTRDFAIRIHRIVTEKSRKDVVAVVLVVVGTIVWAYGDLPFRA